MQRLTIQDPVEPSQVATLVAALRAGQLVVLPTETVYGLAVDPRNARGVERLRSLKGRDSDQPFTHHLANAASLEALVAPLPARIRRFLERVWPGPVTAVLPAAEGMDSVGLRVPAHPLTCKVIEELGHSLFMTSVNRHGQPPLNDADAILSMFRDDDSVTILADAGPPQLGEASAVIRLDDRRLEVLRPGLYDEIELQIGAATHVVFICTGNTCRSPLAQAIAQQQAAAALGVEPAQVLAHGLLFTSAGTSTLGGMPASSGSLACAAEIGLDLGVHSSVQLTAEHIDAADRIFCLSKSHRVNLLHHVPGAKAKIELLDPAGQDVPDPFGGGLEIYRETRDVIAALLAKRIADLVSESAS